MKNRYALFVLTVSLLLQPSSGGIFLMGQQMPSVFGSKSHRGQCLSSSLEHLEFDVPLERRRLSPWKKRSRFDLRRRLASAWTGTRKITQASSFRATSTGDHDYLQSMPTRKLFGLFELNPGPLLRYYIFFRICWWFLEVFHDAIMELKEDLTEDFRASEKKAFSRHSVQKLISWLEKSEDTRPSPPSTTNPSWLLPLAQELSNCSALSLLEVERILLQLTTAEAVILQQCLLSSNDKVDFSEIGGLFRAKKVILEILRAGVETMIPSPAPVASPYEAMISKGNGRQNILLWGPPGNGKTLLIRAFAKKGFPALVISPTLLQSHQKLETFFSLVSTLGSCQLILDDLDGLFQTRGSENHGVATEIQAELLQKLDTLTSHSTRMASNNYVSVFAATSSPWDVDAAAWRRFPNRIYVGLPNAEDRYDLLRIYSKDLPAVEKSVMEYFVSVTDGFIPNDLHQVLVYACQNGPMLRQDTTLTIEDVTLALSAVVPTRFSAHYIQLLQSFITSNSISTNISPEAQRQASSSTAGDYFSPRVIQGFPFCENGYCWETALGNYYQLQIPVDSEVLDAIQTILFHSFEWNPGVDWDLSDDDDDDDGFDY